MKLNSNPLENKFLISKYFIQVKWVLFEFDLLNFFMILIYLTNLIDFYGQHGVKTETSLNIISI